MNITIQRKPSTPQGTFGELTIEGMGWSCHTIELPWNDNFLQVSCIPPGTYTALWQYSPSKGMCYHLQNVPGRSLILIHKGNWAGDTQEGWYSDFLGCIGLGLGLGQIPNPTGKLQQAILSSGQALNQFTLLTMGHPLTLTIKGADDGT